MAINSHSEPWPCPGTSEDSATLSPRLSPGATGTQLWGSETVTSTGRSAPPPAPGQVPQVGPPPPQAPSQREVPLLPCPLPLPSGCSDTHILLPWRRTSELRAPRSGKCQSGCHMGPQPHGGGETGSSPRAHLGSLLLKLLDGPLVDAPAFVDEVASRGGLARVHVADDHYVDVGLLLAHSAWGVGRGWHDLGCSGSG